MKQLIHYTMNPELTWFVMSYSYGEAALTSANEMSANNQKQMHNHTIVLLLHDFSVTNAY